MKRKKQKKASPRFGRAREDGWYEAVDTAIDAKLIRNVKETEGARCFLRGPIGDVQIVEVPVDMPERVRDALGHKLSALGITVLLVNENIKFFKLCRASPEEEEKLNAAAKEDGAPPPSAAADAHASEDPGARSLADGDGSERDQPAGSADASGDASSPGGDAEGVADRVAP